MYKGFFVVITCFFLLFFSSAKHDSHAACIPPAKIVGDTYSPTSIQDAYDYASQALGLTDFTLQLAGEIFTEDLFIDRGAVLLDGGYDCSFTTKTATPTGIFGTLTISTGAANFAGDIGIVSTDQCDFDRDLDGFTSIGSCFGSADDCNDNNVSVYPGAVEICDGLDNDCNGQVDDGFTPTDADGDGYYGPGSCGAVADDCDDNDVTIHPDALDTPYDGIDQDCDGADLTFDGETCVWCHLDPPSWAGLHDLTTAPDTSCAGCHAPLVSNILPGHYGRTVVTDGNGMTAGSTIECKSCHDPNDYLHPWGSQTVWPKVLAVTPSIDCDTCHENRAAGHETVVAHDNRIIIDECGNCHTSDTLNLGSPGTGSLVDDADVDALHRSDCALCHNYTGTSVNAAAVRQAIQQGLIGSQVDCSNCHSKGVNHHGSGSSGSGCVECHGHDAGTLYDSDSSAPYTAGTVISQGRGTAQSHSTHTELDSDDLRGPGIYCDACHDIYNFPYFKSGTDANGDGRFDLAETDVCGVCHSSGGAYDGVDDANLGAKSNWNAGIYAGPVLRVGKQKWCATCHDEAPSVISTVSAPNVVGDEDGSYTYGTGWGYYKTGHGLAAGETFSSKGGVETLSGRAVGCDSCHDYATAHIDGAARTFDDGDVTGLDPAIYRQGYRLKMIDGQEPYQMPRPSNIGNTSDQFRVCFQVGCHDSGPFTDSANMNTNLVTDGTNKHAYHLDFNNQTIAAADWSGAYNSRMTCVVCHNVHGSTRLAMVRDGKLVDSEPGLQIWYKNDAVTYIDVNTSNPPEPEDLPLSASDGTAWLAGTSSNLCANCHGWDIRTTDRTPFQDTAEAPLLAWVGTNDLVSAGVVPDHAASGSIFTFRVSYSDINNDSPSSIEVWVDLDDNGSYAADEKYAMVETEVLDTNLVNGKSYTKGLAITKAGDAVLNYRFYAHDGGLEATGVPTADRPVTILNNAPSLAWTAETFYQADGVNPDIGGSGGSFTFRIDYADSDNEAPSAIQVWIDEDDNGSYDASERYPLTEVDSGDTTYSDGKRYVRSLPLAHAGDGNLKYRFYAADAEDYATGDPTEDTVLTVQAGANSPPSLEFVEAGCTVSGVQPQSGASGAEFVFTVSYADTEGQCPSAASDIQLWVDANDNLVYEASEQYDLTAVDAGDTDCANGKLYTTTRVLTLAGDNALAYRFYATDGADTAVGVATSNNSVEIVDVLKVRPTGGAGWYSTIQSAIDAINGAHTVLVYDGTYNEDILFEFGSNDSNTTLRSVCGPDTTIINGSGSGTTVTFSRYSGSQIDGFQVTGGSTGIEVQGTQVTINNCQIHDNHGLNGGGISVIQFGDMPELTLTNSEIYNNSSDRGGGVRISRGTPAGHIISNSIIRNNTITGDSMADGGGGIHLFQVPNMTISDSVIKDNVNVNIYGGGGLYVSQLPDIIDGVPNGGGLIVSDSIISGNTTGGNGGGVYSDLSKIKFVRSIVSGNTADDMGGALAWPSAGNTISFENCILTDNQAYQAGMAKLNGGTLDIINSTIANNRATGHSGAIYNQLATVTIRNGILWGNRAATVGHFAHFNGGTITISDSIIQNDNDGNFTDAPFFTDGGSTVASGFISEDDPWFVGAGDYHIQALSPALDNASATYAPGDDIDGQSRPQGAADDIGADEYYP